MSRSPFSPGIGPSGTVLGTLRQQRAPEQIADRMLAAIVVGVLVEGERLPSERELTTQLGVSRETVRAALRRLVDLGVVETRRGRAGGTFIKAPKHTTYADNAAILRTLEPVWRDMEQLLDLRMLVHSLIGYTSALRRTAEDVEEMTVALAEYQNTSDPAASRAADQRLHGLIAASTRNRYLIDLGERLIAEANLGFPGDPWSPHLHDRAATQHAQMVDAITHQDAQRASSITAEHFTLTTTAQWRELLNEARSRLAQAPAQASA